MFRGILCVFIFMSFELSYSQEWSYSFIDTSGHQLANPMIKFDADSNPHVLFEDHTDNILKYATLSNNDWIINNIDALEYYSDFTIDSQGGLHIISMSNSTILRYFYISGSMVSEDTIIYFGNTFTGPSMTLDSEDQPHIALNYAAPGGDYLIHYYFRQGNLVADSIEFINGYGGHTDIEITDSDSIIISSAYDVNDTGKVVICTKGIGNWNCDQIYSGRVSGDISMILDANDRPHIAFNVDLLNNRATVFYGYNDGQWHISNVTDTLYNPATKVRIGIGPSPVPHIAFYSYEIFRQFLIHVYRIGDQPWVIENIEPPGFRGGSVDFDIDLYGISDFVYLTSAHWLKFARRISVDAIRDDHFNDIELSSIQAYPNPFNSATTIMLTGAEQAEIGIYDITGRLITTLHTVGGQALWDASGCSSGLYFARLAGEKASSIKLVLVK
jgi:hypothetical protein